MVRYYPLYKWPSFTVIKEVDKSIHDFLLVLHTLQLISANSFSHGVCCGTNLLGVEKDT